MAWSQLCGVGLGSDRATYGVRVEVEPSDYERGWRDAIEAAALAAKGTAEFLDRTYYAESLGEDQIIKKLAAEFAAVSAEERDRTTATLLIKLANRDPELGIRLAKFLDALETAGEWP